MREITFESYEVTNDMATGYKVYLGDEQVATLEFRSDEWIAAVVDGYHIVTLRTPCYFEATTWICVMMTSQENKKKRMTHKLGGLVILKSSG